MMSHPGQALSIYDLASICYVAWDKAATPVNIKSGFRCTGISPFCRNIFNEEDFLHCSVLNRPQNTENTVNQQPADQLESGPSTEHTEKTVNAFVSPETIKPYPRTAVKPAARKGPPRKRSIIATDTPERNEIAEKKRKPLAQKQTLQKEKVKRKVLQESSSDEEEVEVSYEDLSSDTEDVEENANIDVGDYVICKIHGKTAKTTRNFVAAIEEKLLEGYDVKFLNRHIASNRFTMSTEKSAFVPFSDIVTKLPKPITDTRPRFKNMFYFNVDMSEFSIFSG